MTRLNGESYTTLLVVAYFELYIDRYSFVRGVYYIAVRNEKDIFIYMSKKRAKFKIFGIYHKGPIFDKVTATLKT